MDEVTRAYIAGLFDGEGSCFGITHHACLQVRLQIGLTDRALIESIRHDLGFGDLYHEKRRAPYKDCFFIRFTRQDDKLAFINIIKPYIRLKKRQLEIAGEFIVTQTHDHRKLSPDVMAQRMRWADELKILNRRGVPA